MRPKLDRNIIIGIVLLAAMIVGIAATSFLNTRKLRDHAALATHSREVLDNIAKVRAEARKVVGSQRSYTISGNNKWLVIYNESLVTLDVQIAELKAVVPDDSDYLKSIEEIEREIKAEKVSMAELNTLRNTPRQPTRQFFVRIADREDKNYFDLVYVLLEKIETEERQKLAARESEVNDAYAEAFRYGILACLLGLLSLGLFIWLVRRSYRLQVIAAAKVTEQRELLDATLTSIGDAVISTDAGGNVSFMNEVAIKLTGWSLEDARGLPLDRVFNIVNEATRKPVDNPASRALAEGRIVGLANHTILIAKDGTERPIDDSAAPIKSRGETSGAVLVFRDITERKHAEKEREKLVSQLKEQDNRKDEFLATLAHELRNPIAPVRNGVTILRSAISANPQLLRPIEMMERQIGHLVHLVDDLMDVSRVSRGKVILRKEMVEIRDLVETALEATRQSIETEGHDLKVTLSDEPLYFDVDKTRIAQVLANLIGNAAKYTPKGGRIEVSATRENDWAVIRVKDTGIGIPDEMLPVVFDIFTQVGTSLDRAQGGLGIGLTLVRRLVELHNGWVEAKSDGQGKGSEFLVHLPVMSEIPKSEETKEPEKSKNASVLKILVVDDNHDAAESLSMLLQMGGHETKTAHDGPEALKILEAFLPRLVLLDIGMPTMNGYEVAKRIRERPELSGIQIAALTGWGQEEDRRKTAEAGFNFHLVKPADPAAVDKLIASLGKS